MKILMLTNKYSPTDGWSVVSNSIKKYSRFNITIMSGENHKNSLYSNSLRGIHTFKLYSIIYLLYGLFDIIVNFKEFRKFELIHVNSEPGLIIAGLCNLLFGIPYTVTLHGTYAVITSRHKLFRYFYKKASSVIAVSEYTKSQFISFFKEKKIKVSVINNGVNCEDFYIESSIEKKHQIIFVGNLKNRKGFNILLEALTSIIWKEKLILQLVGKFNLNKDVISRFEKSNILVNVNSDIDLSTLRKLYNESMVNVLPSINEMPYFEGFGLIHLESIACGTYTIGTTNNGNEDAIKEKKYLVPQRDSKMLLKVIKSTIKETISGFKPNFSKETFDWKNKVNQYDLIWKKIYNGNN